MTENGARAHGRADLLDTLRMHLRDARGFAAQARKTPDLMVNSVAFYEEQAELLQVSIDAIANQGETGA